MQLFVNTFGASLRRAGDTFDIRSGEHRITLSAKKVRTIVATTSVHFSTDAIALASEHNIDVVLLDRSGNPYGRFWHAKMGSTAAIRRRQIEASNNAIGLETVRAWTRKKLENQADFLAELGRRRPTRKADFEKAIDRIRAACDALIEQRATTVDEQRTSILGYEGMAGAAYWGLVGTLPPQTFRFDRRSRHPAKDPFNAMLNYAYGILYSEVDRACIIAGLDPFVGLLHTDNYNKRSLTFDLIEPFRIWADRIVVTLFTGRRCTPNMFRNSDDGVFLDKPGKELLLPALSEYLDDAIRYPVKSSKGRKRTRQIKRRACIQAEAHTFANRLLGKEGDLPKVMETREVFGDTHP